MRHFLGRHISKLTCLFNVILLLYLASCARLPDYAKPHFNMQFKESIGDTNAFGYRTLTKDDFQASSLSDEFIQYSDTIHARSCLGIRSSKNTLMRISASSYSGNNFYIGSVETIEYEAVFKPLCSWWNPKIPSKRKPYVLEHEQIHFALLELAARDLSRTSQRELSDFIAFGNSVEEVKEQLLEKVQQLGQKIMQENLKVQTKFDEETSLYFNPTLQKRWYSNVMERLKEKQ